VVDEKGKLLPHVRKSLVVKGKKTRFKPGDVKGRTKGVSDRLYFSDLFEG